MRRLATPAAVSHLSNTCNEDCKQGKLSLSRKQTFIKYLFLPSQMYYGITSKIDNQKGYELKILYTLVVVVVKVKQTKGKNGGALRGYK